ncbi:hypothetical protein [Sulfuricurvum sp.]|uniref:hypothetical protein n=1 Tax=Sulfuricurvum sp. TaxID=2025608 RepID=UPI003563D00D
MRLIISIIFILGMIASNAFALVPSDVDMTPAVSDITVVIVAVVSLLVLIMGGRKVLSLLGY